MSRLKSRKKNKKNFIKVVLAIILSAIFVVVILLFLHYLKFRFLNNLFSSLKTPKKINLNLRNIYSDKIKQDLISFTATATTKYATDFDPNLFYKSLKEQFKNIKKIKWIFEKEKACLNIVGVAPFCLINDKFVLGNKRRLFSKKIFEKYNLNLLNLVELDSSFLKEKLDDDVYFFLQKIPQDKFDNFKILYSSHNEINLIPRNLKSNYLLKFDHNSFFEDTKFAATDFILKNFKNRFKRKTKVLDLRFKGRIYARNVNLNCKNKRGGIGRCL